MTFLIATQKKIVVLEHYESTRGTNTVEMTINNLLHPWVKGNEIIVIQ